MSHFHLLVGAGTMLQDRANRRGIVGCVCVTMQARAVLIPLRRLHRGSKRRHINKWPAYGHHMARQSMTTSAQWAQFPTPCVEFVWSENREQGYMHVRTWADRRHSHRSGSKTLLRLNPTVVARRLINNNPLVSGLCEGSFSITRCSSSHFAGFYRLHCVDRRGQNS